MSTKIIKITRQPNIWTDATKKMGKTYNDAHVLCEHGCPI